MDFKPHMTPSEFALLDKYCPCRANALEFGAGGSTQFFLDRNANHLVSVESDKSWLEALLKNPEVFIHHRQHKWTPLHTEIGPTGEWGCPVSKQAEISWLNYHQYCWKSIDEKSIDFVFIDGRFRVACLLQSLLRCTNRPLTIMFHDFWDREYYHCVLDFVDVIDKAETMGVFQPKQNIDWKKLSLLLQERQFDFG